MLACVSIVETILPAEREWPHHAKERRIIVILDGEQVRTVTLLYWPLPVGQRRPGVVHHGGAKIKVTDGHGIWSVAKEQVLGLLPRTPGVPSEHRVEPCDARPEETR